MPGRAWLRLAVVGPSPSRTLARAAVLLLVSAVTFGWLLRPVRGAGISMRPTIDDGALAFIDRTAYWWRPPARGDIVAVQMAGPSVVFIKRVIGLPGEQIAIRDGVVEVDGRPLVEPYVARRRPWQVAPFRLGDDEYLLIGDNRDMAAEDHDFGTAARDRLLGPVRVW